MTTPTLQPYAPNRRARLRIPVLAARVLDGFRDSAGMLADALTAQASEPTLRRIPVHARRDRMAPR